LRVSAETSATNTEQKGQQRDAEKDFIGIRL